MFDFVIADDLIVQGSGCFGLDCVDGENFGFDTIRVKENNTRIQFDDTSTSAGFPNNNWQIRANDSGSGGVNFLGFVDQGATGNSETGTIVFAVNSGASANSLRVGSNSKVGLRTATPVLDMHANTTDTPAIRLEQNNTDQRFASAVPHSSWRTDQLGRHRRKRQRRRRHGLAQCQTRPQADRGYFHWVTPPAASHHERHVGSRHRHR